MAYYGDSVFVVDVDVFPEIDHAIGLAADGKEVARDLDHHPVLEFSLFHDPGIDSVDKLRVREHGNGELDKVAPLRALQLQPIPWIQHKEGISTRVHEGAIH
jgi:hypothetical protein